MVFAPSQLLVDLLTIHLALRSQSLDGTNELVARRVVRMSRASREEARWVMLFSREGVLPEAWHVPGALGRLQAP